MIPDSTPIGRIPEAVLRRVRAGGESLLFERYPALGERIPWRPLGAFPTPVEELPPLSPHVRLFLKRDDRSSMAYGGNKVRKLEYLLGAAECLGRDSLVTLGGTGSNHALATAVHGARSGMAVELALYDQPESDLVRRNLGGFLAAGARVHHGRTIAGSFLLTRRIFRRLRREGADPFFIMVGGTSRLGCMGHVAAGLELADQVEAGLLPEPDRIFLPLGTCGTAAGLIVGLRLAGLRTRVTAVRVADPIAANRFVLRRLAQDLVDALHAASPAIPRYSIRSNDFDLATDYMGAGYGHPTDEAVRAIAWAHPDLVLEPTYTGKAMAAALAWCERATTPTTVLFWHTYNSAPVSVPRDWSALPPGLKHLAPTDTAHPESRS